MLQTLSTEEVVRVWKQTCKQLRTELSPAVYNTWIMANPATAIDFMESNQAVVTISSPTAFHSTNLKKNLDQQLSSSLARVLQADVEINYQIGQNSLVKNDEAFEKSPQQTNGLVNQKPIYSPSVEELFSEHSLAANRVDRVEAKIRQIGLKPDYVFETFAVSTSNEMAHAAAVAVSNNPGLSYNPLFLYGGVGVGKTHLMHAIANNIVHQDPETTIIYCTGEEFTNEIVQAIQTKKATSFKAKYRSAKVLLIDDIQFIAGKNAVQEEFFHTFNALTKQASQIVMTSDRPPHAISLLESRLRSRFEAGLMIDIQQPSFELRTAIVLVKSKAANLAIPMELAQVIASKVESARKIEGIIASLRSEVELKGKEISAELIEKVLSIETKHSRPTITAQPGQVISAVADHFKLKKSSLRGKSRVKDLVRARHLAMYILKEDLSMPLVEIGRWFSDRDHTSVLHACRKIGEEVRADDKLFQDLSALRTTLTTIKS